MSYDHSTMANNMRLSYTTDGTPIYTSIPRPTTASPSPSPTYNNPNAAAGGATVTGEDNSTAVVTSGLDETGSVPLKRKRGRPKKDPADFSVSPATATRLPLGQSAAEGSDFSSPALNSGKKPRGRPPGSVNKQKPAASGLPGVGFMPHILNVKAGEDVLAKLIWFSQNSTRALCVLSANGAVSNVTLSQSATSGGTVTYEGHFEILSLSGSFMVSEVDGQRSRTGGFSVALCGPDGRVLGGSVAGLLTAASPIQVIVGSFVPTSQKQTKTSNDEAEVVNGSRSESSGGGLGSPFDHSNPQAMADMTWR